MNFFKTLLAYSLFLVICAPAVLSSDPIHLAVLDHQSGIEQAPFVSRVHTFKSGSLQREEASSPQDDDESQGHGAAVCSVLVGKNSSLPKDTVITLVPSLVEFSSYVRSLPTDDLVILNWSGSTGFPGLPEDLLGELEGIRIHFNSIIEKDETDFAVEVDNFVRAYEETLEQLPSGTNPLADLLNYARDSLLEAKAQPARLKEDRPRYGSEMSRRIEAFRKYGEEQSMLRFNEMKGNLLGII